jgi:hypothetical protein
MQKLSGETGRLIATRTKHGFDVPLARWLGHELKGVADDCFSESMVRSVGFLRYPYIAQLWSGFRRHGGTVQFARKLWLLLCFMTWHEYHRNGFGFR